MTQSPATTPKGHVPIIARMGKNVAWLLGGKGFSGVTSLVYLALAVRALGADGYGAFSLILAYAQSIANFVQFQSWQGVIRYGALHLEMARHRHLNRLIGFTATLDIAGGLIGAILAVVALEGVAPLLGWSTEQEHRAALFSFALLLSIGATPTGVLRLFDRFDLVAFCEALNPAIRFFGSIIAWAIGADIDGFLLVWAAGSLVQAAATWAVAVHQLHRRSGRIAFGRHAFTEALAENPGIWRFMWQTNLSTSVSLAWQQIGTLAVGATAGATAAGGFRVATKLAKALSKPMKSLSLVLFPEMARLAASRDTSVLRGVVGRVTLMSLSIAVIAVSIAGLAGPLLLRLIAGHAYGFAYAMLLMLVTATAIDLSRLAIEPVLIAHGLVGKVLRSQIAGALTYIALLAALLPLFSANGAAAAAIGSALVLAAAQFVAVKPVLVLDREKHAPGIG